jgi:biotin carboxylase
MSPSKNNLAPALMFVGAGLETIPGIELARRMGLHVVASDANPDAPGFAHCHDRLLASTYDVAETLAAARAYHNGVRRLDGVMCLATDVPLTVASVANELGLPGISPDSARLAADKLLMKDCFAAADVPIPWYAAIADNAALRQVVAERGRNLVVKPVDSRGARGVLRLASGIDLDWAYHFAQSQSPSGRVMVEAYLDGPQVSTETLMIDGQAHTPGFSDRNYEFLERFAPHIIENGGELPSVLPQAQQRAVCDLVQRAGLAMGIRNGVVKGDIVVHDGVPHVIELAARLSGGYFCTHEIPLNTGVDLVGAAIRQALGQRVDPVDLVPRFNQGVAQRFLFPAPGWVESICVPDWIVHDPDIALCEVRTRVGAKIDAMHSHPARAGVIIATGVDRVAAVAKAEAAIAAISIRTGAASSGSSLAATYQDA